jgi:hypothetical protein
LAVGSPTAVAATIGNQKFPGWRVDDSNYFSSTDSGLPTGASARTFCMWCKFAPLADTGHFVWLSYGTATASHCFIFAYYNDVWYLGDGGTATFSALPLDGTGLFHLAAGIDGGNGYFWINDVPTGAIALGGTPATTLAGAGGLRLGHTAVGVAAPTVEVFEARAYGYLLSNPNITAILAG